MNDFISFTFQRWDKKWSIQKVGNIWNLYGEDGYFVKEFRSFKAMHDYMRTEDEKK